MTCAFPPSAHFHYMSGLFLFPSIFKRDINPQSLKGEKKGKTKKNKKKERNGTE